MRAYEDTTLERRRSSFVVSFRTTFGRKSGRGFTRDCVTVKIGSRVTTPGGRGRGEERNDDPVSQVPVH